MVPIRDLGLDREQTNMKVSPTNKGKKRDRQAIVVMKKEGRAEKREA
jgi:hypothetical protein